MLNVGLICRNQSSSAVLYNVYYFPSNYYYYIMYTMCGLNREDAMYCSRWMKQIRDS